MLDAASNIYGLGELPLEKYQGHLVEPSALAKFKLMQLAAAKDGLSIQICSGYRDLPKQLSIWNAKASGKRTLLDKNSQPIAIASLSDDQLVDAILLWSALPGISRHHWGTDIDLFDTKLIDQKDLRLISSEYAPGGPCHPMHHWLTRYANDFGFYFPYQAGLSGVSPEPWHLSYYPKANEYLRAFDLKTLADILSQQEMHLKHSVLGRLETLVDEFVYRIAPWPKT